jgi:uncharacterized membrane protein YfcA
MHIGVIVAIIFALTVAMIMSGRGGGNFYVAALVLLGVPMHTVSTTSQFILLVSALVGAFVFGKVRTMSWLLAIFFGGLNASMAFVGAGVYGAFFRRHGAENHPVYFVVCRWHRNVVTRNPSTQDSYFSLWILEYPRG